MLQICDIATLYKAIAPFDCFKKICNWRIYNKGEDQYFTQDKNLRYVSYSQYQKTPFLHERTLGIRLTTYKLTPDEVYAQIGEVLKFAFENDFNNIVKVDWKISEEEEDKLGFQHKYIYSDEISYFFNGKIDISVVFSKDEDDFTYGIGFAELKPKLDILELVDIMSSAGMAHKDMSYIYDILKEHSL